MSNNPLRKHRPPMTRVRVQCVKNVNVDAHIDTTSHARGIKPLANAANRKRRMLYRVLAHERTTQIYKCCTCVGNRRGVPVTRMQFSACVFVCIINGGLTLLFCRFHRLVLLRFRVSEDE